MYAEAAASDSDATVALWGRVALCIVSVAAWCCVGSEVVGLVDATQRGRFDFTLGRRPRMWCGVRGLRAVVLSSVGCGLLYRAALLLEGERWHVGAAAPEGGVG